MRFIMFKPKHQIFTLLNFNADFTLEYDLDDGLLPFTFMLKTKIQKNHISP